MPGILAEIAGRISTLLAFYDDDFYNVLCDASGHLQIDVLESALPSGAATATNQATIITAVQSLQNLVGALHDVGVDEIDVNVDSSVLPTGAGTSANQATIITALQSLQNLVGALHDVGVDELDVIVESSALPSGAATETTLGLVKDRIGALSTPAGGSTNKLLTDALTALQFIDNLYGALHSVNSDEMVVRGEDQLYSVKDVIGFRHEAGMNADNGYITTGSVPAGELWKVTNLSATNRVRATTTHEYDYYHAGAPIYLLEDSTGWAATVRSQWIGEIWMAPGDFLRVSFIGGLSGDTCRLAVAGHKMTLET